MLRLAPLLKLAGRKKFVRPVRAGRRSPGWPNCRSGVFVNAENPAVPLDEVLGA